MNAPSQPPGSLLKRIAERVCSTATLERLVDPLIADMQHEYLAACARRARPRPAWVRAHGYVAFWSAVLLHLATRSWRKSLEPSRDATFDERAALRRLWSGTTLALLVICAGMWLQQVSIRRAALPGPEVHLYLLPSILTVAVPMSLLFGVVVGLARRRHGSQGRLRPGPVWRSVVGLACLGMLATFVLMDNVLPRANQKYRQAIYASITGSSAVLSKGTREQTLSELAAAISRLRAEGRPQEVTQYESEWHKKLALPAACLVFGLLALGVSLRERRPRVPLAVVVWAAVVFTYYWLLRLGEQAGQLGNLPPVLGIWTPNVVFLLVAVFLIARTRPRRIETVRSSAAGVLAE